MENRRFGVELEFASNGLASTGVGNLLRDNGIRNDWYGDFVPGYYSDEGQWSKIGHDGSELEVRSPILEGKEGFKELKKVVTLLSDAGCYSDYSDGLHVHHDAPDFIDNKELLIKLMKSWKYNEGYIGPFVDEERFNESMWEDSPCPTFNVNNIIQYEKSPTRRTDDMGSFGFYRNNLNVSSLRNKGTIEFRLHEGTLNWDNIEAWIRFGQYFLNGVKKRKNPIMPADSPIVLLNRLKVNKRAKIVLARKAGLVV